MNILILCRSVCWLALSFLVVSTAGAQEPMQHTHHEHQAMVGMQGELVVGDAPD